MVIGEPVEGEPGKDFAGGEAASDLRDVGVAYVRQPWWMWVGEAGGFDGVPEGNVLCGGGAVVVGSTMAEVLSQGEEVEAEC